MTPGRPINLITGPAGPTGPIGATGAIGPAGAAGTNGQGVPVGGTTNQVLAKIDATSYNTQWVSPSGIGGSTGSTDNRVLRSDGTGGATLQNSAVTIDDSGNVTGVSNLGASGQITGAANGAASTPAVLLTGTWFNSGTSTTTKPQLAIEPSGTTSTGWGISGTGIGVNSSSVFAGNLIDLKANNTSRFIVNVSGYVSGPGRFTMESQDLVLYSGGSFPAVALGSNTNIFWETGTTVVGSRSVGCVKAASGQIGINDGLNGSTNWRDLILRNLTASGTITCGTYTVGTLPSAAANTRAKAYVSDSNLAYNGTNLGSPVTAGGAILVPVWSNGTNWIIG